MKYTSRCWMNSMHYFHSLWKNIVVLKMQQLSVFCYSSGGSFFLFLNIHFFLHYVYSNFGSCNVGETGLGCNTFYTLPNFSKPIQAMQTTNIPWKSTSFGLISAIVSLLWHRYKSQKNLVKQKFSDRYNQPRPGAGCNTGWGWL